MTRRVAGLEEAVVINAAMPCAQTPFTPNYRLQKRFCKARDSLSVPAGPAARVPHSTPLDFWPLFMRK
jgi:hypothetical protein